MNIKLSKQEIDAALIYCRVSSQRQVVDGHGNESQEQRCRNLCLNKGYPVEEVFPDDGVSGSLFERPAMRKLIEYLDKHPHKKYVIVFDDLSRFARDLTVHLKLKSELVSRGAVLECLNFNFGTEPEDIFIENVLASKAQLDREQNKRQVIQKQKARLEMGFWCFCNPPGLRFIKDPVYGKVLINNELLSPIFKEAIEGYASNYLNTYEEVREFIQQRYKEKNIIRPLSIRGTVAILTCVLYAGYVEYTEWGVERRKGHHDGFISLETFSVVQEKMRSKSKKKLRADYSLDFPLRRFLVCTNCQRELTGSFNTGRNKVRYAHYWCKTDGCIFKYKSIKTGSVEKQFEELLLKVKPHKEVLNLTNVVFNKVWERQVNNYETIQNSRRIEYNGIEDQINGYMERINKTEKQEMVKLYEVKVSELLKLKEDLEKVINTNPYTQNKFGTALNKITETLNNPITTWKSDNLTDKQNIVYMFFDGKLPYDYQNGFGNTTLEPVINLLNQTQSNESLMVEMGGIEPPS